MTDPSSAIQPRAEWKQNLLVCGLLALVTAILYGPVVNTGLMNLDDREYVQANIHVRDGFSWANAAWAFQAGYASNWHPLTWLSHMLDCQWFGLNYHRHHLVNILLYIGNVWLVFFVFRRMTNRLWPSALVALLFAIHPLHVESAAWLAERKDVLSGLFLLLSIFTYAGYAKAKFQIPNSKFQPEILLVRRSFSEGGNYFLSLFFAACALMSKPTTVTLPCILLLLDWWPLRRIADCGLRIADWKRPIIEKLPFFAMSAVACGFTLVAQRKALLLVLPLGVRCENAIDSYLGYLRKIIWPTDLSIYYPYSNGWPWWQILGDVVLLAGITVLAVRWARRRPYLLFGWLWFLGTLVPAIGVVQAGAQGMADRYVYLPMIGICVAFVWGLADLVRRMRWPQIAWVTAGAVILSLCQITAMEVSYWKSSVALLSRALAVTPDNFFARSCLADAYAEEGHFNLAFHDYKKALQINPNDPDCLYHYGNALARQGRYEEALVYYQRALAVQPDARIYFDYGTCLGILLRFPESEEMYSAALRLDPDFLDAWINRATVYASDNKINEAMADCQKAIALSPPSQSAHLLLAKLLARDKKWSEAAEQYRICVQLNPKDAVVLNDLAWILAISQDSALHNVPEAIRFAERACELTGYSNPGYLDTLAVAYAQAARFPDAIKVTEQAIKILIAQRQMGFVEEMQRRLQSYKADNPYYPALLEEEPIFMKKPLDRNQK